MAVGKGLEAMTDYIVPLILFVSMALALGRKENAYDIMLSGAADGLHFLPLLYYIVRFLEQEFPHRWQNWTHKNSNED